MFKAMFIIPEKQKKNFVQISFMQDFAFKNLFYENALFLACQKLKLLKVIFIFCKDIAFVEVLK